MSLTDDLLSDHVRSAVRRHGLSEVTRRLEIGRLGVLSVAAGCASGPMYALTRERLVSDPELLLRAGKTSPSVLSQALEAIHEAPTVPLGEPHPPVRMSEYAPPGVSLRGEGFDEPEPPEAA